MRTTKPQREQDIKGGKRRETDGRKESSTKEDIGINIGKKKLEIKKSRISGRTSISGFFSSKFR